MHCNAGCETLWYCLLLVIVRYILHGTGEQKQRYLLDIVYVLLADYTCIITLSCANVSHLYIIPKGNYCGFFFSITCLRLYLNFEWL